MGPLAPASGATDSPDDAELLISKMRQADANGERAGDTSIARSLRLHAGADNGTVSAQAASDYHVFDAQRDAWGDSLTSPELIGAGMSVPKSKSESLVLVGLADGSTWGSDDAAFLLDIDGDRSTDLGSIGPGYMAQDAGYTMPLYRFIGDDVVDTGHTVTWMRLAESYGAVFDWRPAGVDRASYVFGLGDDVDKDFAPDSYGSPIAIKTAVDGTTVPKPVAPAPVVPGKVKGLKVTTKRSRAKVRWATTPSATHYMVAVPKSRSHKTWKKVTGTSSTVTGLKPGKRYVVRVRATNGSGNGPVVSTRFRSR